MESVRVSYSACLDYGGEKEKEEEKEAGEREAERGGS